jgi:hypothetical protein
MSVYEQARPVREGARVLARSGWNSGGGQGVEGAF